MPKSANSARPSSLNAPVPGGDEASAAAEFFSKPAATPDVTPQAPAQDEASAAASFFPSSATAQPEVGVPTGGEFAPAADADPTIGSNDWYAETAKANLTPSGIMKQVGDFKDRLITGFASNDKQKLGYLRERYGAPNVKYVAGKVYFRKDPKGQFQHLDPKTLEVASDLVADFFGDAVREGAMIPGEAAGAWAGAAGGPAGIAAGIRSGRAASVPLANAAVDYVGEKLGIPQDPERDFWKEAAIGSTAEMVMPVIAGKLLKFIPGTAEHKVASALSEGRNAPLALNESSREFRQITQDLAAEGKIKVIDGAQYGIEGVNVPVFAHQIQPNSPELLRKVSENKTNVPFLNLLQKQGEATNALALDTLRAVVPKEAKLVDGPIGGVIVDAVDEIGKRESAEIGAYRAKAMAELGNAKQQLPPELSQKVTGLMQELGFSQKRVTLSSVTRPGSIEGAAERGLSAPNKIERVMWVPPKNLQPIIGRLGLDDGQTRAVVNVLNEYGQLISRGNEARLTDIERITKRMGALNPKLQGSAMAGTWGAMTGELRQFRREVIGSGLPDDISRSGFNEVMDKFSLHRDTIQNIADTVSTKMGAASVVSTIISKGKESVGNVKALSALLKESHPEAWNSLKSEWVDQMITNHMDPKQITNIDTKKLLSTLTGKDGKEMLNVLYDGTEGSADDLIRVVKFAHRINETAPPVALMSEEAQKALVKDTIGTMLASKYIQAMSFVRLLSGAKGQNPVAEILTQQGIDKFIDGRIPLGKRGLAAQRLREFVVASRIMAAPPVVKVAAKRGTLSTMVRKSQAVLDATPPTDGNAEPVQP